MHKQDTYIQGTARLTPTLWGLICSSDVFLFLHCQSAHQLNSHASHFCDNCTNKTRVVKHFYPDIIDSLATFPSGSVVAKMCLDFCPISESLRIRVVIRYSCKLGLTCTGACWQYDLTKIF